MIRWMVLFLVTITIAGQPRGGRPCATSLARCPARGCAESGTPEAAANEVRRTLSRAAPRAMLTIDDFESLQAAAERLFRQGFAIPAEQRARLRRIYRDRGLKIGEGDIVRAQAYIVGTPYLRPAGSANCNLAGTANDNIRLHLAAHPNDTAHESIIAEIIPSFRPAGWTLAKLRRLQRDERLLMVTGQLFYDSKRLVNHSPEAGLVNQPARRSLWELHPVSEVLVCMRAQNDCRPNDPLAWRRLADYRER